MTDLNIVEFFLLFFVIGLVYSAIVAFIVQLIDNVSPYFDNGPSKITAGFIFALISIFYHKELIGVIINFLPVVYIVGAFVGVGTLCMLFYLWYQKNLEGYFTNKFMREEEEKYRIEMEQRIKEWEKKESIKQSYSNIDN